MTEKQASLISELTARVKELESLLGVVAEGVNMD